MLFFAVWLINVLQPSMALNRLVWRVWISKPNVKKGKFSVWFWGFVRNVKNNLSTWILELIMLWCRNWDFTSILFLLLMLRSIIHSNSKRITWCSVTSKTECSWIHFFLSFFAMFKLEKRKRVVCEVSCQGRKKKQPKEKRGKRKPTTTSFQNLDPDIKFLQSRNMSSHWNILVLDTA